MIVRSPTVIRYLFRERGGQPPKEKWNFIPEIRFGVLSSSMFYEVSLRHGEEYHAPFSDSG